MNNKTKSREEIASMLTKWRNSKGATQKEIAEYLGIPSSTYRSYENKQAEPSIVTIKQIANYYDLPNIENLIDFSLILAS